MAYEIDDDEIIAAILSVPTHFAVTKHLQVVMTANAQQLESALTNVNSLFGKLQGAVGLLGIGLSAGGLFAAFEHFNSQIVEFKHASDTLGISLENVAGVKLAAGSNWEGVQAGLAKMVKALGEARFGSEEAAKGFKLLGLNVEELSGMKTETALGMIADKMKAIENPTERAYVASLIFKKGWVEMIPILEKGSAGLKAAEESANKFGAVTEKMAEEAKKTKKELKELAADWDALGRNISSATAHLWENIKAAEAWVSADLKMRQKLRDPNATEKEKQDARDMRDFGMLDQTRGPSVVKQKIDPVKAQADLDALEAKKKQQEKDREEALRVQESLQKRANQLIEEADSPWEKVNRKIMEATDLFARGLIPTAAEFDKVIGHIGDSFVHAEKAKEDFAGTAGLERGGAGAFSAQERFIRESEGVKDATRDQLAELKAIRSSSTKTEQNTKGMADALKKIGVAKF